MSPGEQRTTIAEFCGWVVTGGDNNPTIPFTSYQGYKKKEDYDEGQYGKRVEIPDYLNDLNATMEACSLLGKQGWRCVANMGTDGTWECFFTKTHEEITLPGLGDHYGAGNTLTLALVEAILRLIGKLEEPTK